MAWVFRGYSPLKNNILFGQWSISRNFNWSADLAFPKLNGHFGEGGINFIDLINGDKFCGIR